MKIEVFKVGEHTDAEGNTRVWTAKDLERIVERYNNQDKDERHIAPIVIGHPEDNAPAYGWVKKLETDGEILYAYLEDVDEDFAEIVNEGRYKMVSISLYEDMLLRHIGFLGAVPPAVKGLKPVKFKQTETKQITIDIEHKQQQHKNKSKTKESSKQFKETQMPKKTTEENDKLAEFIKWITDNFNSEIASQIEGRLRNLFEEMMKVKNHTEDKKEETKEVKETKETKENADFSEYQKLITEYTERVKKLEEENFNLKFNEFYLQNKEKINSKQKEILYDIMKQANHLRFSNFSEGEPSFGSTLEENIRKFVELMPKRIEFGEYISRDVQDRTAPEIKIVEEYYKNKRG